MLRGWLGIEKKEYAQAAADVQQALAILPQATWALLRNERTVLAHLLAGVTAVRRQSDGAAREEYRPFLELWSHADAGLPELEEARAFIEAH